jgi:hypothetical protein
MQGQKYIFWQDNNVWLGYLEEYPDYMTQGVTVDELEKNLRDIYLDLSSGEIPGVRRVAELQLWNASTSSNVLRKADASLLGMADVTTGIGIRAQAYLSLSLGIES